MDKQTKNIIKSIKSDIKSRHLSKDDKMIYYDTIYQIYGSKIYMTVAPQNIKRKDIKNLLKCGKFEDIYTKYGESVYQSKIDYMKSKDIENETRKKYLGTFYRIKSFIKKEILAPILSLSFALPTISSSMINIEKYNEQYSHLEEIEQYIDNINEYANSVNELNLSDIEVMMKVTKDMWDNIKGYANPKKDLLFFPGLDLADKDSVGVCRNMADDVARKLNAINKNYNAHVLNVYVTKGNYKNANIEFKDARLENDLNTDENSDDSLDKHIQYTGNHAIVMLDLIEDNATVILDPTNPGIGVLKDGNIILFNSFGENKTQENITPALNYITTPNTFKFTKQLLGSYRNTSLSIEELREKYGLKAQNKALDSVLQKETSFRDTIVVNLDDNLKAVGSISKNKVAEKEVDERA